MKPGMKRSQYGLWIPDDDTHFVTPEALELDHVGAALKFVKHFGIAVDGGAHIGGWTRILSRRFAKVYAFEPNKENFDCLTANVQGNVHCKQAALGDKRGRASMHPPVNPHNSGAGWLVEGDDFDVVKLDDEVKRADFIKLDVEGYEPYAIRGAKKLIERSRPIVLVEQKPITARYGLDYMQAGSELVALGYQLAQQLNKDYIYRPVGYDDQ